MKTSISDYDEYKNFCQLAASDDLVFSTFRQHAPYTAILEHVSYELGQRYADWIGSAANFTEKRLETAKLNDVHGGATIVKYNSTFNDICPSTLRYLKVALELEQLFGSLDNFKIVEIGVGYGGQCNLISNLWNINSYTLIDLQEPLNLSKKFLENDEKKYWATLDTLNITDYDLVISNYAFSECSRNIQLSYVDVVLNRSRHGYITYNNISHLFNVDSLSREEFKNVITCTEIPEIPVSGDNSIFYW